MVHDAKRLVGTVTRSNIQGYLANLTPQESLNVSLMDVIGREPVVAYPDEPLRFVVNRMAVTGLMRFPVVQRGSEHQLLGIIGLEDLLKARELTLEEEHKKERVLRLHLPLALRRLKASVKIG